MRSHLLIGLGGTGGKVLKNFRKALYEEFRQADPSPDHQVHLKYLYIDSNKDDLDASGKWQTQGDIGGFIGLSEESRFPIYGHSLKERLQDRVNNPVTHEYIGDVSLWGDVIATRDINKTAGGQIRRLGEALFEPNTLPFLRHTTGLVNNLITVSNNAEVAFHVFAGLAGGTGSGTFLQIVAQLRAQYQNALAYPIYLYLLLPEEYSEWAANGNRTNYYANGYAALQELNAYLISTGQDYHVNESFPLFEPTDLAGNTKRFRNQYGGSKLDNRLQGCFLISTTNEARRALHINEIPELIAQFIYQRVFVFELANVGQYQTVRNALSFENQHIADEVIRDGATGVRSQRFQAFGIKRYVIPEEEIREYCMARFARQAALQMRYNNWGGISQSGEYLTESRNFSLITYVEDVNNLKIWKLSDDHLKLNVPILDDEEKSPWSKDTIEDHWREIAGILKKRAWEAPDDRGRDQRLTMLDANFSRRYNEGFRSYGVVEFYRLKRQEMDRNASHIREVCYAVEQWLFTEWEEGRLSATDLERLLDELLVSLVGRKNAIVNSKQRFHEQIDQLSSQLDENQKEWNDIGIWLRGTKKEQCFERRTLLLRDFYEKKTLLEAWMFAERLLDRVIAEFTDALKHNLTVFRNGLDEAIEFFKSYEDSNLNIVNDGYSDNVIRFYDPAKIRVVVRSLLENEQQQQAWAGRIRREFTKGVSEIRRHSRGREGLFASLVVYGLTNGYLKQTLDKVSRENAQVVHNDVMTENERLFGVNIVDKLSREFSDSQRLLDHVTELVKQAQTFTQYEPNQFNGGIGPESVLAVFLPQCIEKAAFRSQLSQMFKNAQPNGVQVEIIDTNHRFNEITLISVKYKFPLRYLLPVHVLKDKYDFRLRQGEKRRAILEVHTEDRCADLPSLLRPAPGMHGESALPFIAIVAVLDLMVEDYNREVGVLEYRVEVRNHRGIVEPYFFSKKLVDIFFPNHLNEVSVSEINILLQGISVQGEDALKYIVSRELSSERYRLAENRNGLHDKLLALIDNIRVNRDNDFRDRIYIQFKEAVEKAIGHIQQSWH